MGQGVQLNLKMRDQRFSLRYRKTCNPWGQDYVLRGLDSEIYTESRRDFVNVRCCSGSDTRSPPLNLD